MFEQVHLDFSCLLLIASAMTRWNIADSIPLQLAYEKELWSHKELHLQNSWSLWLYLLLTQNPKLCVQCCRPCWISSCNKLSAVSMLGLDSCPFFFFKIEPPLCSIMFLSIYSLGEANVNLSVLWFQYLNYPYPCIFQTLLSLLALNAHTLRYRTYIDFPYINCLSYCYIASFCY